MSQLQIMFWGGFVAVLTIAFSRAYHIIKIERRMKHRSNIRVHYIWMSWNTYSCPIISGCNVITDLKTTTYTFKQRRRLILFKTEDDILIEVYKTSKRYVPAFMCRRFSNGYPNFNFDYYHYILEVQYIPFNTEDDVQSQPSMNSPISILSVSLPLYCRGVNTSK